MSSVNLGVVLHKKMNVESAFNLLNKNNVRYAVLRNWELFYDDLLIEGHNDIDLLCNSKKDKKMLIKAFNAKTNYDKYDGKYYFYVDGTRVFLDIKIVGDGYYCKKWEKTMIKNRIKCDKGFFVLSDEDYLFSIIYHFLIHKNKISDNYVKIVECLSKRINVHVNEYSDALLKYMETKKYFFSIPYDKNVGQNYISCSVPIKEELSVRRASFILKIKTKVFH